MSDPGSDNIPNHSQLPMNNMAIVPAGSVSIRVNQLFDDEGDGDPPAVSDELSKKQKKEYSQTKARSVAAAMDNPAGHNELFECELPGLRAAQGISGDPPCGGIC